ncbi:DUF6879 family protein [Sphaerisporangium corydalis]|uniref:DUF6879 family protein n=1 Tax=Sphaerisporangium corydalis TaxID=1441875 RepID=A0ABV9E9R5_9ACTN|nr:DUF6879 family protein [Sphaerisporangium corydalis]
MEFVRNVFDRVRHAEAWTLSVDAYQTAFAEDFERATAVWKLERAQEFYEPDVASWRALMAGDWEESLALLAATGPILAEFYRNRPGVRRIRIVDSPPTAYLQWEMHVLAVRAAAGEHPRVLPTGAVREFEHTAPLPELVSLGPSLLYEVLYDEVGGHLGGRRITDPDVTGPSRAAIQELYDQGEELMSYFDREIAPLPPPDISSATSHPLPDHSHHTGTFHP